MVSLPAISTVCRLSKSAACFPFLRSISFFLFSSLFSNLSFLRCMHANGERVREFERVKVAVFPDPTPRVFSTSTASPHSLIHFQSYNRYACRASRFCRLFLSAFLCSNSSFICLLVCFCVFVFAFLALFDFPSFGITFFALFNVTLL